MRKIMTLGTIVRDNEILLGMKKRGFGAGRWNGFGGKLLKGELVDEALKREFKEEASVDILDFKKMGVIDFEFKDDSAILEVHIYKILEYEGEPVETEEMKPKWFEIDKIPYESMWPDDPYWLPLFLKDKKFGGKILFKDQNTILKNSIAEI